MVLTELGPTNNTIPAAQAMDEPIEDSTMMQRGETLEFDDPQENVVTQ